MSQSSLFWPSSCLHTQYSAPTAGCFLGRRDVSHLWWQPLKGFHHQVAGLAHGLYSWWAMDYWLCVGQWTLARYPSSIIFRCHSPCAWLPVDQAPFYACLLLKYGCMVTLWMQCHLSPSWLATRARPRMTFWILLVLGVTRPGFLPLLCHFVESGIPALHCRCFLGNLCRCAAASAQLDGLVQQLGRLVICTVWCCYVVVFVVACFISTRKLLPLRRKQAGTLWFMCPTCTFSCNLGTGLCRSFVGLYERRYICFVV